MKAIGLLIIVSILLDFTGFQKIDKKEMKARQRLEMAQLIESGKFRFVARSANSQIGTFNNFSYNYDLTFNSLQIIANLPYYGRAYSVSYGSSEGGVKFNLTAGSIVKKWNEKKKTFTISTELSDKKDSYSVFLSAGLDGYAYLTLNFRDRSGINYSGIIEKIIPESK
jgi:hypothetical protein